MDRLSAMATFLRVVDAGSFSAAARQLGIGQPAVSKTIAELEGRLGVRLLIRSTRGLSVSEAGRRFLERARRALEEADEAERAARGEGAGLDGLLRVSVPTTFARLHIVPRLPEFLGAHPRLDVDLVMDDRVIDLVEEGIDVALRMGALADTSAVARRIGRSARLVLASEGYVARAGAPQEPVELAAREAVIFTRDRPGSLRFIRDGNGADVVLSGRLRVSSAEGLRAAVLADIGFAVASAWMFAPELASGAVRPLLRAWSLPTTDLWAVFPTGRLASAKARAFASFAEAALRVPELGAEAAPEAADPT